MPLVAMKGTYPLQLYSDSLGIKDGVEILVAFASVCSDRPNKKSFRPKVTTDFLTECKAPTGLR